MVIIALLVTQNWICIVCMHSFDFCKKSNKKYFPIPFALKKKQKKSPTGKYARTTLAVKKSTEILLLCSLPILFRGSSCYCGLAWSWKYEPPTSDLIWAVGLCDPQHRYTVGYWALNISMHDPFFVKRILCRIISHPFILQSVRRGKKSSYYGGQRSHSSIENICLVDIFHGEKNVV